MKIKYYCLIDLNVCDYRPYIDVDFRKEGLFMYSKYYGNYFSLIRAFKNDCFDCLFYGLD